MTPRLAAIVALAGATAGGVISVLIPVRYTASVTVEIRGGDSTARWLREAQQRLLSRASLTELIQRPGLDLYGAERLRQPMEDVIETMRRDVKVEAVDLPSGMRAAVTFVYPDAGRAQSAAGQLASRFATEIARTAKEEGVDGAVKTNSGLVAPERNRALVTVIGMAAGALAGLVILLVRKRSWQWYVLLLGFGIAGGLAAELAAYFADLIYPGDLEFGALGICAGVLCGVWLLGRGQRRLGMAGALLAIASAGAIAAGMLSFVMPQQFVSRATLRLAPELLPGKPTLDGHVDPATRVLELSEVVMSRSSLAELMLRPSLDLYRSERSRLGMDEVIQTMRRDLRIETTSARGSEAILEVSFRYRDRLKAQAVDREMVAKIMEEVSLGARTSDERGDKGSLRIQVVDPPSLPEAPAAPNQLMIMAAGAGLATAIALLFHLVRRQSERGRRKLLRIALGMGAAGALTAAVIAIASPVRYLSTAALRVVIPGNGLDDGGATDDLHTHLGEVLGATSLIKLMQRPELDLYAKERSELPVKDVIRRMRERDLRVETLRVSRTGRTEALRISFEYPDRVKAQAFVQALVSQLVETGPLGQVTAPPGTRREPGPFGVKADGRADWGIPMVTRGYVEVVDPPSLTDFAAWPSRLVVIVGGLLAALVLAAAVLWLRPGGAVAPADPTVA